MKIRAPFFALLAAAVLGACTSTSAVMLGGGAPLPERHPDEVLIFPTEEDVPVAFERIALVTSRSDADWADEADLIRAMQRRAAKLGATGLILDEVREPSTLERVAEVVVGYEAPRRGRALAIRLID